MLGDRIKAGIFSSELERLNSRLKKEIEERKVMEKAQSRMQARLSALWKMARMVDTDFRTLSDHILSEVLLMTDSKYAFLGALDADEQYLNILSWSSGVMTDCEMKNKLFSFPLTDLGLLGESVRNRKPMIVNQYDAGHPAKKGLPLGHVPLSNVMAIPVFLKDRIKFLIAVANKPVDYTIEDLEQVDGFASNVQIVLDRQKTEDHLKKSEERYRELVEGTSDLIMRTDHQGNFLFVNHMSDQFFGLSPEELVGLYSISFIHPEDKEKSLADISKAIQEHLACLILENRLMSRKGIVHEVYWTINLHYNDHLEYTGSSAIGRDITKRKRMEENLIKIKKLEATGLLAGGIAHDFNNLLFVIMGNIELIKTIAKPDGKTLRFLEQAEQATSRAVDLTRKFITFSSGGEPVKAPVSINQVILEVKDLVLSGANIDSECVLDDRDVSIKVDKGQISQVFSIVIDNAKHAMPNGGKLVIRSEMTDMDHEQKVSGFEMEKGRYVKVIFSDTGQGIKPTHLDKVFDPYFSTREKGAKKGLGLGLSIVHSILKKHDGHIQIESTWGKGTTVSIYLPVLEEAAMAETAPKKRAHRTRKRLLLMDDEEQIRIMSKEILETLGYRVTTTSNGEEAVAGYQSAMDQGKPFDLVLLDLTVKGGMGGIEAVRHLRSINPDVKAIIFSGYAADPIMSDFSAHGFKAAVIKPVAIPVLHETIEKVLNETRP